MWLSLCNNLVSFYCTIVANNLEHFKQKRLLLFHNMSSHTEYIMGRNNYSRTQAVGTDTILNVAITPIKWKCEVSEDSTQKSTAQPRSYPPFLFIPHWPELLLSCHSSLNSIHPTIKQDQSYHVSRNYLNSINNSINGINCRTIFCHVAWESKNDETDAQRKFKSRDGEKIFLSSQQFFRSHFHTIMRYGGIPALGVGDQ